MVLVSCFIYLQSWQQSEYFLNRNDIFVDQSKLWSLVVVSWCKSTCTFA